MVSYLKNVIDSRKPNQPKEDGKGGDSKWIAGAVKRKGALHRALGIPEGEKIPTGKISEAAKSGNEKLAKQARLAQTLSKLRK